MYVQLSKLKVQVSVYGSFQSLMIMSMILHVRPMVSMTQIYKNGNNPQGDSNPEKEKV